MIKNKKTKDNKDKATEYIYIYIYITVESKTRTYHGRVGSGRPAERLGGVGQDYVPIDQFAQEDKIVPSKGSQNRRLSVSREARTSEILFKQNLLNPKLTHTTSRSRRGAPRSGGAESRTTVRKQNCAPREQSFLALSKALKTRRLNVSPEAQTSEILCKPKKEKTRFTNGLWTVYQRFTCRIQNPDIPRAGCVGARGGAAERGRARLGANKTIRQGNKGPSYVPKNRRQVASTSLEKNEQAKFYLNLSSPKPGHTTGGSGRHGARRTAGRGDARQNKVPTFRWSWKPTAPLTLQRTVKNCPERLFARTNKENPM